MNRQKIIYFSLIFFGLASLFFLLPEKKISLSQSPSSVLVLDSPPNVGEPKVIPTTLSPSPQSVQVIELPENLPMDKDKFSMAELFILDNLFDSSANDLVQANHTSLGDLFILNSLFNKHELTSEQNHYSLNDLFVLDQLFNFDETTLLDQEQTSISDLFILEKLFNN